MTQEMGRCSLLEIRRQVRRSMIRASRYRDLRNATRMAGAGSMLERTRYPLATPSFTSSARWRLQDQLVSRTGNVVNVEGAEARGRQGATSANIGHILARSNEAGRDAAAVERNKISGSG